MNHDFLYAQFALINSMQALTFRNLCEAIYSQIVQKSKTNIIKGELELSEKTVTKFTISNGPQNTYIDGINIYAYSIEDCLEILKYLESLSNQ